MLAAHCFDTLGAKPQIHFAFIDAIARCEAYESDDENAYECNRKRDSQKRP